MQLTFLGGADEVGASCILLEIAGKRMLVDAGIRISPRTNRGIQNSQLPDLQPISATDGIDYILVTHAHTDHTGALPLVVEQYPHVPVLATRPTVELTRVLQQDAQRIMTSRHEQEGELPLFDEIAVERLMSAFREVEFNQSVKLGEGLQVTYYVSGHIAGAALLVFESMEGTLVISGDLSMTEQRTVKSAQIPRLKADALVLESTYGGRLHANRVAEERRLIDTLKRVTGRGGRVLIPAFALGRAQEVIQIILAFQDEIDVPVYVDGMVRSVCDAYARFQNILPQQTIRLAGGEHLFFRHMVKPVRNTQMRAEVVHSENPCIVVASSGMLTGGASVVYAQQFARDERNAILLTGYQDEESPGRFLQNLLREKEQGDTPSVRFTDTAVSVRCEIGSYSLSAHADEGELISVAEALGAPEIMLVHGDAAARHSLAAALRQRQRSVRSPKIGEIRTYNFKKKPWAIGRVWSGNQPGKVILPRLWESLKPYAGDFYSVRELAQIWNGAAAKIPDICDALESADNLYFARSWRDKNTYQVRSEKQVQELLRSRAIISAHPDLAGKLVVLRNSNNRPRLGVVRSVGNDSFEAEVHSARGSRHPAHRLLWVIGDWGGYGPGNSAKAQLADLTKDALAVKDILLPFTKRAQLAADGKPVNPASLLPDKLPDGVAEPVALTAIVLALADDGATLQEGGLLPRRATAGGPVEQNLARDIAFATMPQEARLRKVGMDVHRRQLSLVFDFPQVARQKFANQLEQIMEQTGWDVQVKQTTNQQALVSALNELLPENAHITGSLSFYMDNGEVWAEVANVEVPADLARKFAELTGFRLVIGTTDAATTGNSEIARPGHSHKIEINQAYHIIRSRLEPHGLLKAGLKQDQIVLTFITPQIGERHTKLIEQLAHETGYPICVHPYPNQYAIMQIIQQLAREAGWTIDKGPGIHVERAEVSVTLKQNPDEAKAQWVEERLIEKTGYRLNIRV